jgi:Histidine kinase-, DNA gyrase B-, and HSP90-like ATPase
MKVSITGASAFVNRMFEACGPYQWAREFLKNALEALASRIEFGIEWQAVEKYGVYRRTIIDNGSGMDRDELLRFFSTLGAGAKKIGGIHDNYGVGAKIASLPWNPLGVVVISYKDNVASMIWIILDPESGDYELREFKFGQGMTTCVVDPSEINWVEAGEVDWSAVAPEWIREHGTAIVLLGSEEYQDTVMGNALAGEKEIKGLSIYLNSRFWDLSPAEVKVVELRSEKKNSWPTGPGDRDDARRPNNRQIMGARHYLTDVKSTHSKLADSGISLLAEDRVSAEWYLWQGERPNIETYAKRSGYVAVRYNGELYHLTSHKVHFRWFGLIEGKVQQVTWIILEPQHFDAGNGRWGIHADQSRNRLIFTGNGEKGVELPLSDWGLEFAENMPASIRSAIQAARGELSGSIDDEEYRKRLQDKFGSRWTVKILVAGKTKTKSSQPAEPTETEVEAPDVTGIPQPDEPKPSRTRGRPRRTMLVVQRKSEAGGSGEGIEREVAVDIPRYKFGRADDFDHPSHLALWAPNDPEGPTVTINVDSPILDEVVRYHQEQYPDVYADEVRETIQKVFGEVAVAKVAHSQRLSRDIPQEVIDRDYRSEAALTISLMGLLAEESLIAQRLGKLGRKKSA